MKKIIIIGSGPAGISAALYTARAGIDTMVIARDAGALQKAEQIENYYGIGAPLSGSELHARGLKQAEALGVPCIQDEVFGVSLLADNRFSVTTATKTYEADAVLLATGAGRRAPAIPGLAEGAPAKTGQVKQPTKTICMVDCGSIAAADLGGGYFIVEDQEKTWGGRPMGRHGGVANVLWVDGHVSGERMQMAMSPGTPRPNLGSVYGANSFPFAAWNSVMENYWDLR